MRNLWWVFFFAALAMSAPAFGREPDAVVKLEFGMTPAPATVPTAPCTDKPCVPVVVEPIRLVPVGTSNPAQPGTNSAQSAAPAPAAKPESSAPWWVWPVLILALAGIGFLAWRNRQAEAERERLAREAADRVANEARERRAAQEIEARSRERLRLVKAVEDANADFRRWRTSDNEDRLRDALWRLAECDGTIVCDPSGYTVSVPAGCLRVVRPFLAGGPQVTPSATPPPPADKPADKPTAEPIDKSKPDDKKGEDKPASVLGPQMMSEGQERLLRKLLMELGITDKEAQDRRLASELGPPDAVTREQAGACIERFKAELVAKRAAEAEAQAKAKSKPAGDKPKGNGGQQGGGAVSTAPTTTAASATEPAPPAAPVPTPTLDPNAGQGGGSAAPAAPTI